MAFYRESLISRFAAGHASLHLDGLGNALQILGDVLDVLAARCVIVADEDNLARPRRSGDRGIVREGSVHGVVCAAIVLFCSPLPVAKCLILQAWKGGRVV